MAKLSRKKRERNNRIVARVLSSLNLLILLLMLMFPFMSMSVLDSELARKKQRKQIVINFSKEKVKKFESARSKLSQEAPKVSNPLTPKASASPPPAPNPTPKTTTPTPTALPKASAKQVLTTPKASPLSMPSFLKKKKSKKQAKKPVEEELPEEGLEEEEIEVGGDGDPTEEEEVGTGSTKGATASEGRGEEENGGSKNEGSEGLGGEGKEPSDGVGSAGYSDFEGPGEGEGEGAFGDFGRAVIYRADAKGLASMDGKITLKICVNQDGRVTYSKVQEKGTTIYDEDVLRDTELLFKRYRFEKDFDAPPKQCGKYTFIAR